MTRYAVLIYDDEASWEALSKEETAAVYAQYEGFGERNATVIKGGNDLAPTSTAISIRRDDSGRHVVTDGAFVESKEVLGGYYIIEVKTLDQAIAVVQQVPIAAGGVEVRPLTGHSA